MPFFVSHGAPNLAIADIPAARFLKHFFVDRPLPEGILVVSAHWETQGLAITSGSQLNTIHDFRGFDQALYQIHYPARTADWLIDSVTAQLTATGHEVTDEPHRGLDHGAWVPLRLMLPNAQIPVVQLSLDRSRLPSELFALGKALSPLSEKNILILGSGALVHNLSRLGPEGSPVPEWASQFDQWVTNTLASQRWSDLCRFTELPISALAHPTPEHFLPLIFAAGAAAESGVARRLHHSYCAGSLSMSAWEFGHEA